MNGGNRVLVSLWTGSLFGERVEKSLSLPSPRAFFTLSSNIEPVHRLGTGENWVAGAELVWNVIRLFAPPLPQRSARRFAALSGVGRREGGHFFLRPNKPFLFPWIMHIGGFSYEQWLKTSTRPCHFYPGDSRALNESVFSYAQFAIFSRT